MAFCQAPDTLLQALANTGWEANLPVTAAPTKRIAAWAWCCSTGTAGSRAVHASRPAKTCARRSPVEARETPAKGRRFQQARIAKRSPDPHAVPRLQVERLAFGDL